MASMARAIDMGMLINSANVTCITLCDFSNSGFRRQTSSCGTDAPVLYESCPPPSQQSIARALLLSDQHDDGTPRLSCP